MTALDSSRLKIESRTLYVPPLEELKTVFSEALSENFAEFSVEIVDSPDLKEKPFTLAASGLGGKATILEVGGPLFLRPLVYRDKVYNIKTMAPLVGHGKKSFVIGAAGGPWPYINSNCELIMNLLLDNPEPSESSRIAFVDKSNGKSVLQVLPEKETRFALMANLFLSEGKAGKVLKVYAKKRTGKNDFIATMQKALASHYTDKFVGLGGTFLLKEGKAKQHVMPDFSETPINTLADLHKWLNFYDMSAPLIAVGTFVSAEPDLDLKVQHFHSFSHHGEGGHYHIDTTPDFVEYLGYFTPGETFYRVDQPPVVKSTRKN